MKKILIGLAVLVVVIGVVLWQVYANLDTLVKRAIEEVGTEVTETGVTVDNVELQLLEGKAAVSGLAVANPAGFSAPNIFALDGISVAIDIDSLQSGPIVIDELVVSNPQVFVEINDKQQSNLTELKKNIEKHAGSGGEGEETESSGEATLFIIRRLAFEGGQLSATSALTPDRQAAANLPPFEMTDLGEARGGATASQLATEILARLTEQAARAAGKAGVDAAKKELEQKAREKLDDKLDGALGDILGK